MYNKHGELYCMYLDSHSLWPSVLDRVVQTIKCVFIELIFSKKISCLMNLSVSYLLFVTINLNQTKQLSRCFSVATLWFVICWNSGFFMIWCQCGFLWKLNTENEFQWESAKCTELCELFRWLVSFQKLEIILSTNVSGDSKWFKSSCDQRFPSKQQSCVGYNWWWDIGSTSNFPHFLPLHKYLWSAQCCHSKYGTSSHAMFLVLKCWKGDLIYLPVLKKVFINFLLVLPFVLVFVC